MTWAWFVWVVLQRAYWLRESKVGGGFVAAAVGAVTIVVGVVMMDIHFLVAMILQALWCITVSMIARRGGEKGVSWSMGLANRLFGVCWDAGESITTLTGLAVAHAMKYDSLYSIWAIHLAILTAKVRYAIKCGDRPFDGMFGYVGITALPSKQDAVYLISCLLCIAIMCLVGSTLLGIFGLLSLFFLALLLIGLRLLGPELSLLGFCLVISTCSEFLTLPSGLAENFLAYGLPVEKLTWVGPLSFGGVSCVTFELVVPGMIQKVAHALRW